MPLSPLFADCSPPHDVAAARRIEDRLTLLQRGKHIAMARNDSRFGIFAPARMANKTCRHFAPNHADEFVARAPNEVEGTGAISLATSLLDRASLLPREITS